MSIERRVHPRQTVDYPCWLSAGGTAAIIEGQINNISQSGAKLSLRLPGDIPDRFDLFMTRDGKVGRHCRVVWREGAEIGLEFVNRIAPPQAAQPEVVEL